MGRDISFSCEDGKFRMRACGVIIKDGKVLMIKNERDPYIYSVGGAVKIGETSEEACEREIFEETGVKMKALKLLFIHENFFSDSENSLFHETAFYYLMDYNGEELSSSELSFADNNLKEELIWVDLQNFPDENCFPKFFGEKLGSNAVAPAIIVTHAN